MERCDVLPDCLPLSLRAGCKVNLNLWLTAVRPDGWHELDSIFIHLPTPHDTLTIMAHDGQGIVISCDTPGIDPSDNTLTKAWTAFARATGREMALRLHLEKGIPHGAGLGGGSSDAAALLLWLNAACGKPLDDAALRAVGAGVGADVPFFLQPHACRATGTGDRLTPVRLQLTGWHLVLVCPPVHVSTPWAYKAWDEALARDADPFLTAPDAHAIRRASIDAGGKEELTLINDFEPVVFAAYPALRACKELLFRLGAQGACMSGSGASVFGLFRDGRKAALAGDRFKASYPGCRVFTHKLTDAPS